MKRFRPEEPFFPGNCLNSPQEDRPRRIYTVSHLYIRYAKGIECEAQLTLIETAAACVTGSPFLRQWLLRLSVSALPLTGSPRNAITGQHALTCVQAHDWCRSCLARALAAQRLDVALDILATARHLPRWTVTTWSATLCMRPGVDHSPALLESTSRENMLSWTMSYDYRIKCCGIRLVI